MPYDFVLVDVFTDEAFGGNQLAVLTDARGLADHQMQAIAREFNFAETTFVLPAEDPANTARLRIFSPGAEMPFAGHPTVGSAAVLDRFGILDTRPGSPIVFEELAGLVQVSVTVNGAKTYSELTLDGALDRPDERPDQQQLAAALSLPADAVSDAWFASVGLRFCFCQLQSAADVDAAVLDNAAWSRALKHAWAQHLFFFSGDLRDGSHLHARMFAPGIGVAEDPATGSAVAALVAVIAERDARTEGEVTVTVNQGVLMNRPSTIAAAARKENGALRSIRVGGSVQFFGSGTLSIAAVDGATGDARR